MRKCLRGDLGDILVAEGPRHQARDSLGGVTPGMELAQNGVSDFDRPGFIRLAPESADAHDLANLLLPAQQVPDRPAVLGGVQIGTTNNTWMRLHGSALSGPGILGGLPGGWTDSEAGRHDRRQRGV